jgi:hypothetical protein
LDKVAEFLKEAKECMAMAGRATDGHRRDQLLLLAEKWTQLASAREKMLRDDTQKQQ